MELDELYINQVGLSNAGCNTRRSNAICAPSGYFH